MPAKKKTTVKKEEHYKVLFHSHDGLDKNYSEVHFYSKYGGAENKFEQLLNTGKAQDGSTHITRTVILYTLNEKTGWKIIRKGEAYPHGGY